MLFLLHQFKKCKTIRFSDVRLNMKQSNSSQVCTCHTVNVSLEYSGSSQYCLLSSQLIFKCAVKGRTIISIIVHAP